MGAADTVVSVIVLGTVGGVAAYMTNFNGFKTWVDTNYPNIATWANPPPPPPPTDIPPTGNEPPVGNQPPPPQPLPRPAPGQPFSCVTYPRCNTVSGTDARKICCCKNKCALIGRTYKSADLARNMCYCNPKPAPPPPTKCLGPCPLGQRPGLVSGRCGCVACKACAPGYKMESGCRCRYNCNCPYGVLRLVPGGCTCKSAPAPTNSCICPSSIGQTWAKGCEGTTGSTCTYCCLRHRCSAYCASHGGGTPTVLSNGNCTCKTSNQATIAGYGLRANEASTTGLMDVPTLS